MESQASTILDVMGAVNSVERPWLLGLYRQWNSINPFQQVFFDYYKTGRHLIGQLEQEGLIEYMAGLDAPPVNKWLAKKGLTISLKDLHRPGCIYIGSIYRQLVNWQVPGSQRYLDAANGRTYHGALLDGGLSFYDSPQGMVAAVATTGKDVAYFMPMASVPSEGPFGLMSTAMTVQNGLQPMGGYGELLFPMVDLDIINDATWLMGANTVTQLGQKATVAQALQQARLKLNHLSALAESGFAMGVALERYIAKKRMEIISPFLFWINRPGIPFPMFTSWVNYPEWNNPGEIK